MSTMKDKKKRVAELELEIKKIWAEPVSDNYELVAVTPDGGGMQDSVVVVAICKDIDKLRDYCKKTYSYTPDLSESKPSYDKDVWGTWYRLRISDVIVVT